MQKIYSCILLVICLILSSFNVSNAQKISMKERVPFMYVGAYILGNYNMHSANFTQLGNFPNCCPQFSSGTGFGLAYGGVIQFPIQEGFLFETRLGLSDVGATLKRSEDIGNTLVRRTVAPFDTITQTATVEHTIDSRIQLFTIEPSVRKEIFIPNLYGQLGLSVGIPISSNFDQREQLITPTTSTFVDGRTIRNEFVNQAIPDVTSLFITGVAGLSYRLPIGKYNSINPEVRYQYPFTSIAAVDWKPATLQFGASLLIGILPPIEKVYKQDTLYFRDTIIVEDVTAKAESIVKVNEKVETERIDTEELELTKYLVYEEYKRILPKVAMLNLTLDYNGVNPDGSRTKNPTIVIEETEQIELFPLLPQIFFQDNSSILTASNQKLISNTETTSFDENGLPRQTLDIHSQLLNIVGSRMKSKPGSTITLIGHNNTIGDEGKNKAIALERAEVAKKYLTSVWQIEPNRIQTKAQNLPTKPSNNTTNDGQEENRRVEFTSNNFDILQPLKLQTITKSATPPTIEILPKATSEVGVQNWEIDVVQKDKSIRNIRGKNATPEKILWNILEEPVPLLDEKATITFTATDVQGLRKSTEQSLSIQQLTIRKKRFEMKDDKRIERYSLILFDFNKADLSAENKAIGLMIRDAIKPNSTVTIAGYADRQGQPEYNRDLAKRRCDAVKTFLGLDDSRVTIKAIGSDELLFNNDLAEGRSYSRTVQVIIETPVEE
jgi:outer membrane protein OmpA-like peptidoglycan-associated protein